MNSVCENRAEQSDTAHMGWNALRRHVIGNQKLFLMSLFKMFTYFIPLWNTKNVKKKKMSETLREDIVQNIAAVF